MSLESMKIPSLLIQKQAVDEIEKCNGFSARFGLILSRHEAAKLAETRTLALKSYGRIEFGGGVIPKIIRAFCDSPYISMDNYAETLHCLIEAFYFYKNETLDMIGDDGLIEFMKDSFDGKCQGSKELLCGKELARMARDLRCGFAPDDLEKAEYYEEDGDGEY